MTGIWNKKIILYGDPVLRRDFAYLFDRLDIAQGDGQDCLRQLRADRDSAVIVLCEKERDPAFEKEAGELGLAEGRDYLYIRDFFPYYNPMFLERGSRKLAVWGTGAAALDLWRVLDGRGHADEIDFYIDNGQERKTFQGKDVVAPSEIKDRTDVYIIVATWRYQWEIYSQLAGYGFRQGKDYTHCSAVSWEYGPMLENVCFSDRRYAHCCPRPSGYCDVIDGSLYLCCPDFLPVPAGDMHFQPFLECYDSYVAHILRLSVCNGTFAFCNQQYCDLFDFGQADRAQPGPHRMPAHPECPETLMVGIDHSCNLKCPSCREKVCVADAECRKEIDRMAEDLLEHAVPYVNRLWMAGNGEVFFSPTYRRMLEDGRCRKRESISILSNGTLFGEACWRMLEGCFPSIEAVISMDGIHDATIEKLRRGADAGKLKGNLEFLGKMRKEGKIDRLFLSCVLQAANVGELYELLEYCRETGVDKVQFLKLKDNGTYHDRSRFEEMSLFDEEGRLKEKYRGYFTEELLTHPLADWFNNTEALGTGKRERLDAYDTF